MHGIFIDISDIEKIHGCSYATAQRRMQIIRDSLQKKGKQQVSIREFCEFEGIGFKEFFEYIKAKPGQSEFKY